MVVSQDYSDTVTNNDNINLSHAFWLINLLIQYRSDRLILLLIGSNLKADHTSPV